jgi:predicted acylesterase/phospholipase RssA
MQNIVINGGGPTIFNAYGALKQANLSGVWSYDSVEAFYGTSAGAILAVILALQYSWEDLDDFIIKRPWQNVWKFNLFNVYDYYTNKGIFGKEMFHDFLGPLFKGKDLELDITLRQFHETFGKSVFIYAVSLTNFELVEFSHLSHPDMPVLEAVRASSSLPILFQPVEYKGNFYTDGGFLMNYPLAKCGSSSGSILGIRNKYTASNSNVHSVQGIFEYLSYILSMIVNKIQIDTSSAGGDITNREILEIEVNTGFVDYSTILSLANSAAEREALIVKGMADATECLTTAKAQPSSNSQTPPDSDL